MEPPERSFEGGSFHKAAGCTVLLQSGHFIDVTGRVCQVHMDNAHVWEQDAASKILMNQNRL